MLVQSSMPLLHPVSMPFQDRNDKGRLRWKVMMDTRLPNLNRFCDVGITEGREPSLHQQLMGHVHDPLCSISMHTLSDYLLVGLVTKYFPTLHDDTDDTFQMLFQTYEE